MLDPTFTGRVSRRDIALGPYLWFALTGTVTILGVAMLAISFVMPDVEPWRIRGLAIASLAAALVLSQMQPPEPGSWKLHTILIGVYVGPAIAIWAYAPQGSAAVGASMFVGPLTAVWLVDRRQIAAHYVAASIVMFTPSALGLVDTATLVACITLLPAMWVLGICCVVVLESAEAQGDALADLVERDPLTGVGNRRALDTQLPYELQLHAARRKPLSVVTLDLNGFKQLNDSLGHAAGDELLREVAQALIAAVDSHGAVVRPGGDEFCVLLPGQDAVAAAVVVARIRRGLAALDSFGAGIGAGIGGASFPADGRSATALIAVADRRLLDDKRAQRAASAAASDAELIAFPSSAAVTITDAIPVAPHPQPLRGEVSRRELALDRTVWTLHGSMYLLFAALGVGVCVFTPDLATPAFPYVVAFGAAVGVIHLLHAPVAVGTRSVHLLVALTYIVPLLCLITCQPGGSAATGSAIFIGPLAAIRIIDRRLIVAHLVVASTLMLVLIPSGIVNATTTVAILLILLTAWVLAACVAVVMELAEAQGEQLAELALRDPLTGIANRRHLTEFLTAQIAGLEPDGGRISVVALDLNGFKQLNDEVGHAAGDELLKAVAACLRATARPDDLVARQGGDEFCVVLPGAAGEEAEAYAQRAQEALAQLDCNGRPLSSGFGIATWPQASTAADELLHRADAQLVKNKQAERDARRLSDDDRGKLRRLDSPN